MTITIEIALDAHGSRLEVYAANLLAESVLESPNRPGLTESDMDITLHETAQFSHAIPALPESAFTRESFYLNHD